MTTPLSKKVFLYSLGGGLGHFTRTAALARKLTVNGITPTIATNSKLTEFLLPKIGDLRNFDKTSSTYKTQFGDIELLPGELTAKEIPGCVADLMHKSRFDAIVVDTFPRGLAGELIDVLSKFNIPKFLTHRILNDEYIHNFPVEDSLELYESIFIPGEPAPFAAHPKSVSTAPWLIRDHNELLDFESARTILKAPLDQNSRVVAVIGGGTLEEIEELRRLSVKLQEAVSKNIFIRFINSSGPKDNFSNAQEINHWPIIEAIRGIDLLIGGGGYNLVNEAHATKTPLAAFSRKRLYDGQENRLREDEVVATFEQVVGKVNEISTKEKRNENLLYKNGVNAAADVILNSLHHSAPNNTHPVNAID